MNARISVVNQTVIANLETTALVAPSLLSHFAGLRMAEYFDDRPINIFIGADIYPKIFTIERLLIILKTLRAQNISFWNIN